MNPNDSKRYSYEALRHNMNRYITYTICSIIVVMAIFMYSTILYNPYLLAEFPQASIHNVMRICYYLLIIFSMVFISYAHMGFIKNRSKDFGLYLITGMEKKTLARFIQLENSIIMVISIGLGLLMGTVFSRVFFMVIATYFEAENLVFVLYPKNYIITVVSVVAVYIIIFIMSRFKINKMEVIYLIREPRIGEKSIIKHPIWGVIGFSFIGVHYYILSVALKGLWSDELEHWLFEYMSDEVMIFVCATLCFVGVYLVISSISQLMIKSIKRYKGLYYKKIIMFSELKYRSNRYRKIFYIVVLSSTIVITTVGIVYSIVRLQNENSKGPTIQDIMVIQTKDEQRLVKDDLRLIANHRGESIQHMEQLEYVEMVLKKDGRRWPNKVAVLSDQLCSQYLEREIDVEEGKAMAIVYFEGKPWYREIQPIILHNLVTLKEYTYAYQEELVMRIYGGYSQSNGWSIILDHKDYRALIEDIGQDSLREFSFIKYKGWLVSDLEKANQMKEAIGLAWTLRNTDFEEDMVKRPIEMVSTQERMKGEKIEFRSYFFALTFVGLLFFMLSGAILFFKVQGDIDHYRKRAVSLLRVGITNKELKKVFLGELRFIFYMPIVMGSVMAYGYLGIIISTTYSQALLYKIYNYSLVVVIIYFLLQSICYQLAVRTVKKVCE